MFLLKEQRRTCLFLMPDLRTRSSRLYISQLTVLVSAADVFAEPCRITDTKNNLCQNVRFPSAQFICFVGLLFRHQRLPSVLIQTNRDRFPLSWHSQFSQRPRLFLLIALHPCFIKSEFLMHPFLTKSIFRSSPRIPLSYFIDFTSQSILFVIPLAMS
jgi:hypothetical protein